MPSKNIVKEYQENSFYHVYNRGVNKKRIFIDDQDFRVLLYCFKLYLSPFSYLNQYAKEKVKESKYIKLRALNNAIENSFYKKIELHSYILMPNHIHLVLKQIGLNDLKNFMQSIFIKYSMYFNKRYQRVGPLYQSRYKAVLITSDNYLLHLMRYLNLNSVKLDPSKYPKYQSWKSWRDYPYSSYHHYINSHKAPVWLTTDFSLNLSGGKENYIQFNENFDKNNDLKYIKDGLLE
jgi:putative transposase